MASNKVSPARRVALEILQKVEDGHFSSVLLPAEAPRLEPNDRALCHELVLGVLRWQLKLDKLIEHYANRKVESLDRAVLIALRLGLYQLRFLTRIPASAAVNESVKLVQAARLGSARPFVNAVLRRATREPEFDPATDTSDPISRIAVDSSHPRWLVERWAKVWGIEETENFARANNATPATAFRIVQRKVSEEEFVNRLRVSGIDLDPSRIVEGAWRTTSGAGAIRELAVNGEIYLQDEASQLVADLLDVREQEKVLDVCAAPGGKTTLIGRKTPGAYVFAGDSSQRRLKAVSELISLHGLTNVSPVLLDAARPLPFQSSNFDRVLLDAPCSGTGTLRHNPEIRWRISADDVKRLANQQFQFLENAARVVKPAGHLVYSTCSVEMEENEDVIARFLQENPGFVQVPINHLSGLSTGSGALRTWPHRNDTDGFFVARLQRIK